MDHTDRKEFGQLLKEVYTDVLLCIVAFAAIVAGTFLSSKISWEREVERKELKAAEKIQQQAAKIDVWVQENRTRQYSVDRVGDAIEVRDVAKMEPGVEYLVGQLRVFDTTYPPPLNRIKLDPNDDSDYFDPVITVRADNIVHIRSSLGYTKGWMICGPTDTGLKTGEYRYYPAETDDQDYFEGWGKGMTSVRVPLNGKNNIAVSVGDPDVDEDLQEYNYYYEEKLGEVYDGVPEKYANRSRLVWVSHLIVSAYDTDPRDAGAKSRTPSATVKIRFKNYTAWDLTQEEYDEIIFAAPGISEKNYFPYATAELIIG